MLAVPMALIALLLGTAIGRRISLPLASLSTAIHKLAQGKLNHRVQLQGDSEFVKLGQDINTMAQIMEDAHNNRRRLTADISHELRTPLTFLRGQLEGMQSGSIALDSGNIALVQDEVIRLTKLVRELEDLTLIENHAVPLNLSKFTIAFLLERLQPVYTIMQDQGITFIVNTDPEISEITADLDRLLQILLNLFSNAVQHSAPNGSVELAVKKEKEQLLFAVADNGSGIPAAELPHLFERFYRVDEHRNRRSGGLGLGLAIARGYAETHKGKMWAESQEGQGTTIYFTLSQS
jgi:signal transduction histidine kinase